MDRGYSWVFLEARDLFRYATSCTGEPDARRRASSLGEHNQDAVGRYAYRWIQFPPALRNLNCSRFRSILSCRASRPNIGIRGSISANLLASPGCNGLLG